MAQQTGEIANTRSEELTHGEGRLVSEHPSPAGQSGTSGVSDTRRAELERLEAAAGTQHEAADESVPQQGAPQHAGSGLRPDVGSGRPAAASGNPRNPDIDKR